MDTSSAVNQDAGTPSGRYVLVLYRRRPGGESFGRERSSMAGSLSIQPLGGSRSRLRQTRQPMGFQSSRGAFWWRRPAGNCESGALHPGSSCTAGVKIAWNTRRIHMGWNCAAKETHESYLRGSARTADPVFSDRMRSSDHRRWPYISWNGGKPLHNHHLATTQWARPKARGSCIGRSRCKRHRLQ